MSSNHRLPHFFATQALQRDAQVSVVELMADEPAARALAHMEARSVANLILSVTTNQLSRLLEGMDDNQVANTLQLVEKKKLVKLLEFMNSERVARVRHSTSRLLAHLY